MPISQPDSVSSTTDAAPTVPCQNSEKHLSGFVYVAIKRKGGTAGRTVMRTTYGLRFARIWAKAQQFSDEFEVFITQSPGFSFSAPYGPETVSFEPPDSSTSRCDFEDLAVVHEDLRAIANDFAKEDRPVDIETVLMVMEVRRLANDLASHVMNQIRPALDKH